MRVNVVTHSVNSVIVIGGHLGNHPADHLSLHRGGIIHIRISITRATIDSSPAHFLTEIARGKERKSQNSLKKSVPSKFHCQRLSANKRVKGT